MGFLWPLEPATAAKHRLYKSYFDAWWPILLQPSGRTGRSWPKVTFLDAFAGPGRYEAGEEGSPVFNLHRLLNHDLVHKMNLSRERVQLISVPMTQRKQRRNPELTLISISCRRVGRRSPDLP